MGRLSNMVIFLIALQAILIIFEGQAASNTSIWDMAIHPQNWNSLMFLGAFVAVAATIGVAGMFLGAISTLKTDFMVFSSMIAGLLSLGFPIVQLANVIGKYASNLFCETAIDPAVAWSACPGAVFIVAITAGSLGVYYAMTVVDWWRGRA